MSNSSTSSSNVQIDSQPQSQTEQKVTPANQLWPDLPTDWEFLPGAKVYRVNPGYRTNQENVDYVEMDALDVELPWPKYVGVRDPSAYGGQMFSSGDTLFARITPCTENGKTALVGDLRSEVGIGSTEFIVLSPRRDVILPPYLYYLTKSYPVRNYAISRMRGSTGRQRVPASVFRRELSLPVPPLDEQRKIASVLHTVDQLIEETKNVEHQGVRLRRGLQDKLLKTGIGTQELQEVRLGPVVTQVPRHWERARIGDLCQDYQLGTAERGVSEDGQAVPLVKMGNLGHGTLDLSEVEYVDSSAVAIEDCRLEEGDLLFNTRNTPELVGKTAVWDSDRTDGTVVHDNNILRLRFYEERTSGQFVNVFLSSSLGRRLLRSRVHGTTSVAAIYWGDLRRTEIPLPPLDEQKKIAVICRVTDRTAVINSKYRAQLKRLKKGLMQALLSGRVRTDDKNIAVIEEVAAYG